MSRVIVIVMDGCGVGALPDATEYSAADAASDTLRHVIAPADLRLRTLESLGLYRLLGIPSNTPVLGAFGRCCELSKGKDSVTGHWELMGIVTALPFPTYPHGFPNDVIEQFERKIGRGTLGNVAASGTEIIAALGREHERTGRPIVYTSADSVFQVAAHEDVIAVEYLYRMCETAREMLIAPDNVQRVIARPFVGSEAGGYVRSARRKDYALAPPEPNVLSALNSAGRTVHGIGVVCELFPRRYFAVAERTQTNRQHLSAIARAVEYGREDLVFANCEDFDMLYGHRNDPAGFAVSLAEFDKSLGVILDKLRQDDLLLITADHGNDPTSLSTDHSREYVPILAYGSGVVAGRNLGTRASMCDIGATVAAACGAAWSGRGTPLV